ncbi:HAMP domain-containing histidine kinase [Paenibacillus sp. MER TA 81-3]|uniref:sensor histidine kinase n=1 Tax=Paenibacillus sp. MER TA 81-3 TaxID=2939573 RepID=UPI00203E8216|nr:HAMP domain-containing sensor histidine kinase [Paenibacillus sp. MER TA 81-3]MCM3339176.1 HAMP domain-containing histidine kinase [Paenibacillus sp. MER TA 81-3]
MNKLSRKLFVRFSLIVGLVVLLTYLANTFLLPQYYLHQKKANLAELTAMLDKMEGNELQADIKRLEQSYGVTIVHAPFMMHIDELNENVKLALGRKGITLSKFWITDDNVAKLAQQETVHKIYSQAKLKSSFLVTFMNKENELYAIGESVAHSDETLQIVNRFALFISAGALLVTLLLSAWSARRILQPLAELKETAEDIAELSFRKADIQTGDEIESLAASVNAMSDKLERAHRELHSRNENLRGFISDISHELKTPLALIKAYAAGIKDGLDDGTYTTVIENQADDMTRLVERLLELSRLQAETYQMTSFDFMELLAETVGKYRAAMTQQGLTVAVDDGGIRQMRVIADRAKIEIVLNNLITNAIKYASGTDIHITVRLQDSRFTFSIQNSTGEWSEAELERIWEPFSVAERSRSKQLSGTGLGLSLVRTIMQKHDAPYGVRASEGMIEFYFTLPVTLA